MIAVWISLSILGFAVMVLGSRRAADEAILLVRGSRLPPFVIGMTVLAIGTDLPEIANSIAASAAGHGDLNVGDSFGSTATQVTLILGLLPFFYRSLETTGRDIPIAGMATVVGLGAGLALFSDGHIGRVDALVLIALWVMGSLAVARGVARPPEPLPLAEDRSSRSRGSLALATLGWLAVVGGGAVAAVFSLVEVAEILDVPEFVISFFAASIGTSLPELIFNITALRRGQARLALGDLFGASLADSTLSVAAGPLLFPTAVTVHLVVRGALSGIVAVAVATLLLGRAATHDRRSGAVLLLTYAAFYLVLL